MVRSIGADQVIDYTREDFTRSGRLYDVVLDNAGNHPLSACRRVLSPKGVWVMVGGPYRGAIPLLARVIGAAGSSLFSSRKVRLVPARRSQADLAILRDLMETGKVTPVIDRVYPLSEAADAVRYLEEGHARGKVVVAVDHIEVRE
jgi:NADPH:quinone reductase-like Zn-dependent oxidoreductase